jgi:hypothetical protein
LPWIFDHAETIDVKNIERVKALGGGIAIQSRMAFQGEYFTSRYGANAAQQTPPVKRMLEMGVPVGAGTDATRVSSYNPWIALYWLVSGKTVGGLTLYNETHRISREDALELYTRGSAWFSNEQQKKGSIKVGMFADLTVLTSDYLSVADEDIKHIESDLTIVDGRIVYADGDFSSFSPDPIAVLPDWSPTIINPGYFSKNKIPFSNAAEVSFAKGGKSQIHNCIGSCNVHGHFHDVARKSDVPVDNYTAFWGVLGCSCFAF